MLVACAGIALSAALFIFARGWEQKQLQIAFNRASEDRISALQRGIEESLQELESINAFYAASEEVTRKEFHDFVRPFLRHNPSVQALAWVPRVPASLRATYEQAAQRDGLSGFQFTERKSPGTMVRARNRTESFPVYFVEPYANNKVALGFDLASEPIRFTALEQARDSGAMAATARLTLLQGPETQLGFLAFQPVYRNGARTDSLELRRKNLAGFALGVFRIGDMMEKSLSYLQRQDIEIQLYDDTAEPGNRFLYAYPQSLHSTSPHKPSEDKASFQKGLFYARTIDVAGRKWTFLCMPTPQYLSARRTLQPWVVLGSGLLVTGFLTAYIFLTVKRTVQTRQLTEQIAKSREELEQESAVRVQTEQTLHESEEKFGQLFEHAPIGMALVSTDYKFLRVNKTLCELLQYTEEELIGLGPEDITYPEDRETSLDRSRRLLSGEGARFQVEKRYVRKDGGIIWGNLTAAVIHAADGKTSYGLGIIEDITKRKWTQDALQESEQRYRSLFDNMLEGFAYCQMLFEHDEPRDFVYLSVNNAFEKLTGLKDVVGKKVTEVIPGIQEAYPEIFKMCGRVALTGKPERFEIYSESFGGWLSGSVYSTEKGYFIAVFDNVTGRKQRERELEAIFGLSVALRTVSTRSDQYPIILDHVSALLKVEGVSIAIRDPASGEVIVELGHGKWEKWTGLRLPPGEGILGNCISTGQTCASDDASAEPHLLRPELVNELQSVVCVPLIAEEQTIGALIAGGRANIKKEEVHLLKAIGEIAAIAIHRLTLHEKAVQQMQHLAALHEIDVAISSSLDLRLSLKVLLGHVTKELGADAAAVLLMQPPTQTLTYAAGQGFRTREIEQARIKPGEGCAGRAALERAIVSVPDNVKSNTMCAHVQLLKGEAFVSHHVAPLIVKGRVKGVLEVFHRSPLVPDAAWMDFFEALAGQAAIAVDSATLFNDLQHANDELVLAYDATIEGWSNALDLRDKETEGHSQRVTVTTVTIARAMGIGDDDLVHVRRGALLHDIGKMGIPDNILLKPGKLTDEEWNIMRNHPVFAYKLLSPIAFLKAALDIPYYHHEKWDGAGYPHGLKGEQIPLAARIFAVVDVWDALGSDRPYRPAWPKEKMLRYLRDESGKHFDPKVVEIFIKLLEDTASTIDH
jgi:PAS domain S-box-containing protein